MDFGPLPLSPWDDYILAERNVFYVLREALSRAVDVMMLGYIAEANRIFEVLNNHNLFILDPLDIELQIGIHHAWSISRLWPSYVLDIDPSKPLYISPETERHKEALRKLRDGMRGATSGAPRASPTAGGGATEKDLQSVLLKLNFATEFLGMEAEELEKFSEVIQTAIAMEEWDLASDVLKRWASEEYFFLERALEVIGSEHEDDRARRHQIASIHNIWTLLADGIIAKELGISCQEVSRYISEGIVLLDERLTKGPARPFANKSVQELVGIIDDSYRAAEKATYNTVDSLEDDNKSVLRAGASDQEIFLLEEYLASKRGVKTLPEDYKELLRHCNGIKGLVPNRRMACPLSAAKTKKLASRAWGGLPPYLCLVPSSYAPKAFRVHKMLYLQDESFILGGRKNVSRLWLIGPSMSRNMVQILDKAFENASAAEEQIYNRIVGEIWGGVDNLKNPDWLVIEEAGREVTAAREVTAIYKDFREYLEHLAELSKDYRTKEEAKRQAKIKKNLSSIRQMPIGP